jgi:hypothetical protein
MSIGSTTIEQTHKSPNHQALIAFTLKRILRKYWYNTETRDTFYKVVVGGQNVLRCCKQSMHPMPSSDIDIDFVVIDESKMSSVRKERMSFLKKIVKDADLIKKARQYDARLEIQVMKFGESHEAHHAEIIRVNAVYSGGTHLNILDTTMYTTQSRRQVYYQFIKYFGLPETTPIPFKKVHGIAFASCKHAVYDTFRMLCYYGSLLGETRRANYNKLKFMRMVAKMHDCRDLAQKYKMTWIYDRIREALANSSYPDTISDDDLTQIQRLVSYKTV